MKFRHNCVVTVLVALAVLSTSASAAVPIRGVSNNGEDGGVLTWLLLGRTGKITLSHNGNSVVLTREVVCPSQDVEATLFNPTPSLAGSCDSGQYMFIFQFTSSSTDVNVQITHLPPFTPDSGPPGNYGVLTCDNNDVNTLELCTTLGTLQVPDITFSTANHTANFVIPSFPNFKAGTPSQGKGLTLFIVTQDTPALRMDFPLVSIQ